MLERLAKIKRPNFVVVFFRAIEKLITLTNAIRVGQVFTEKRKLISKKKAVVAGRYIFPTSWEIKSSRVQIRK